jgi:hypothetical protein
MGKRWRPPRWATQSKPEKDPELEKAILQVLTIRNRANARTEKKETPEYGQISGTE